MNILSITVLITYTGKEQRAQEFMQEMLASGLVEKIRAQAGNERYEYFLPVDHVHSVLLIDRWTDQHALDSHHRSPMMKEIATLRKKYKLSMQVETFQHE